MQQTNLITLMFSGVDASLLAKVPTEAQSTVLPGQADFMLTLQQQLWAANLPQAGSNVDPQLEVPVGEFSAMLMPETAEANQQMAISGYVPSAIAGAAMDASTGMSVAVAAWPQDAVVATDAEPSRGQSAVNMAELSAALVEVLRSILDGGLSDVRSVSSQPEAGSSTTATLNLSGDQHESSSILAKPVAVSEVVTASVSEQAVDDLLPEVRSLFIKLSQQWPQVAKQLEQLVSVAKQTQVQVELGEPQLVETGKPGGLPWADQTRTAQSVVQQVNPHAEVAPGLTFSSQADGNAASIKWFVEQGILTTAAQTKSSVSGVSPNPLPDSGQGAQVVGATEQRLQVAAQVTKDQSQLATDVKLFDGSIVRASIVPLAIRADGVQHYTLQVSLPEPELGTLSAELTVRRLDVPALSQLPQAEQSISQAVELPQTEQLTATQVATTQPEVTSQGVARSPYMAVSAPAIELNSGAVQGATEQAYVAQPDTATTAASAGMAEPVVQAQVNPEVAVVTATSESAAPLSQSQAQVVKSTAPVAKIRTEQTPLASVSPQLAEEVEVPEFLVATTRERPASVFDVLGRTGGQTPPTSDKPAETIPGTVNVTTQVDPLVAAVNAEAGSTRVEPQLMQFQTGGLEYLSSQLDYAELMQRVMGEASKARAAGNGLYHARLDLNPPNLGRMYVNISVRGDNVALQLAVVSTVPKEQLKDSLASLRESLEEAGLNVAELKIVTLDPEKDDNGHQEGESQQQSDAQHQGSKQTSPWQQADPAEPTTRSAPYVKT